MKNSSLNLVLFKIASKKVKAYKEFLKIQRVDPGTIKDEKGFKSLPVTDKKSYLSKYPFTDLFIDGKFPPMAYASSGSSGKPIFWFRGDEQEKNGGEIHGQIFQKVFGIKKDDP